MPSMYCLKSKHGQSYNNYDIVAKFHRLIPTKDRLSRQ